jgi:hypothetical protein
MVEYYEPVKNDSLKVGIGENDFLPFIQKGYTLMLPENPPFNNLTQQI